MIASFVWILLTPLVDAHTSLFYTDEEITYLKKEIHKNKNVINTLKLNGIIFTDENNWVIWINGKCIRSDKPCSLDSVKIKEVTASHVNLSVSDPLSQKENQVTLLPNQEIAFDCGSFP